MSIAWYQFRELRWLRKNGDAAFGARFESLADEEAADLRELYGELDELGLVDGLLFADNRVWCARLTAKGKRESSIPGWPRASPKTRPVSPHRSCAASCRAAPAWRLRAPWLMRTR